MDARDHLYDLLERGNASFASGRAADAIRQYDSALGSFLETQHVDALRTVYQKLWSNKAMAHQQLRQYPQAQEAAMIANALLEKLQSQPAPAEAGGRCCRRCGQRLEGGSGEQHPSLAITRCSRCDYRNVLAGHDQRLPFTESLAGAGQADRARDLLSGARTSAEVMAAVDEAIRVLVSRTLAIVDEDPAVIAGGLWAMLEYTEDELRQSMRERLGSDAGRSAYTKAAALIYGLVARHGVPEVDGEGRRPGILAERLWPMATDAAMLGTHLRSMLRGEWEGHVDGGEIVLRPTDTYLQLAEFRVNRHHLYERDEQPIDEQRNALFDQLLGISRGYSFTELLALIELIGENAKRYVEPGADVRLMWPMRERLTEQERRMLDDFALTPARVRQFAEPFYLDLGERAHGEMSDVDLGRSLAVHAWTSYYPIFPIHLRGNEHYLLPLRTLNVALVNLKIFKSRLFELLFESIRSGGEDAGEKPPPRRVQRQLGSLRTKLNRLAEQRAASLLRRAGWATEAGRTLTHPADGVREEIDLLAARRFDDRIVLLMGEVKDFDLGLHRASAQRNFARRLEHAAAQVTRKAAFVEQIWPSVLADTLHCPQEGVGGVELLAVLITSEYLPLAWIGDCAVLCEDDLERLDTQLADMALARTVLRTGWRTLQ